MVSRMTDAAASPARGRRAARVLSALRRTPVTLSLAGIVLIVGVVTQGLWSPVSATPLWDAAAYGLPAFEAGRWWTAVTGTFLVAEPVGYALIAPAFAGIIVLELWRGSRLALATFVIGQLFAIFATALIIWPLSLTGWPWAVEVASSLDVGLSGGLFACLAAAAGILPAPWRLRALVALLSFVSVTTLFWGDIAAVEHLLAVVVVVATQRTLRLQRSSVREQRLMATVTILLIGVVEIIALLVPTSGPFGDTEPADGAWLDILIDVVVIGATARALLRGRRWAWVVALVLSIINVVSTGLGIAYIAVAGLSAFEQLISSTAAVTLATAVLWFMLLLQLIVVRAAFRSRRRGTLGPQPAPTASAARDLLRATGGGTLSWMTTWPGLSYLRTGGGMVAYANRAGVALALADPLGPEQTRAASVREFVDVAERAGLVPAFFSAGDATKAAVPPGWRSLVVADDTIVDLPGLAFTGKAWGSIRTALNRAEREGMTFRLSRLADEPFSVRAQLRAISDSWVGDKGLPEMGFTLGTLSEAEDPEVRLALAVAKNGDVDGFLSWLPVYADGGSVEGWTLDLMRRRDGGFPPVMEYLIASSAVSFREQGARVMSLSGAPLAHEYPPGAGVIAALSDRLAEMLEPVYGFGSLHRFKEKFHPRYETLWLLYRDEADLARIGPALVRAFLPEATIAQFAGAGIELVRGRGRD